MKRAHALRSIWAGALLVGIAGMAGAGCDRKHPPGWPVPEVSAQEAGSTVVPPEVERELRRKGEAIAAHAFGVLGSRLGQALAEGGETNAIQFCSVHGLSLTRDIGLTNDVVLRRVTHRPRNPANRADSREAALIARYQGELRDGRPLEPTVVAVRPDMYTFYAPIVLKLPLCLKCHGEAGKEIDAATVGQLRRAYPADEAVGFRLGELRGLWSIDFRRAEFTLAKP